MGELTQKLEEAKVEKDHQQEYKLMINHINKEPPRDQTSKALEELQQRLNVIDTELNECTKTVESRSKQCYAAFSAVQALNRSISQSNKQPNKKSDKTEVDEDNDVKMQ